jgi:hypothetical protein
VVDGWVKILLTRNNFVGHIQGVVYGYRTGYAHSGGGGGGGGVTDVNTGCGLSGGPITTTGTIALSQVVNKQTGTTYAFLDSDCGKLVTFTNAMNIMATIPQAGAGGSFVSGWSVHIQNRGAGSLTITPTTSTIDGGIVFTLIQNQGIVLFSDGTNYFTERGANSQVSSISTGCGLSGGPIATTGTIALNQVVNAQTGTTYAVASTDCGKLVNFSNSGSIAVSIAQAGTGGFVSGWSAHFENLGAGTVTVTPSTSTIDGVATLTLAANQGIVLFSDGANYFTERGRSDAGAAQLHSITFAINGGGSTITTGDVHEYITVDFNCTINRVDISGNPSGSMTVDIWKVNAAIPTGTNKISASAPATLSSSQLAQSGSLSGWSTSVAANDVFDANVATASSVTSATVQLWCQ